MAKLSTYEILKKTEQAFELIESAEAVYKKGLPRPVVEAILVEAQGIAKTLMGIGGKTGMEAGNTLNIRIVATARAMGYVPPEPEPQGIKMPELDD